MKFGAQNSFSGSYDPIVKQAEKILAQRKARGVLIDPGILGEPGWDILLSYFIAGARGHRLEVQDLVNELNLSHSTVSRWRDALAGKGVLDRSDENYRINSDVETKLRALFTLQIKEEQEFTEFG